LLLHHPSDTKGAIEIFPKRKDVDRINNARIDEIRSQAIRFSCYDNLIFQTHHRAQHPELSKYGKRVEGGTLKELVSTAAPLFKPWANLKTEQTPLRIMVAIEDRYACRPAAQP
jgi:hypothetical protein